MTEGKTQGLHLPHGFSIHALQHRTRSYHTHKARAATTLIKLASSSCGPHRPHQTLSCTPPLLLNRHFRCCCVCAFTSSYQNAHTGLTIKSRQAGAAFLQRGQKPSSEASLHYYLQDLHGATEKTGRAERHYKSASTAAARSRHSSSLLPTPTTWQRSPPQTTPSWCSCICMT